MPGPFEQLQLQPMPPEQPQPISERHLRLVTNETDNLSTESLPSSEQKVTGEHDYSEISDLIKVDDNGRGHRPNRHPVTGARSGQFASNYEMDQIVANQDLIRNSLDDWLHHPPRRPSEQPPNELPDQPYGHPPTPPPMYDPRPRQIETGGPSGPEWMYEFPEDMAFDLATALNEYTQLAAARERATITPGLTKEKVELARQNYESLRLLAKRWTDGKMEQLGLERPDRIMISKLEDMTSARIAGLGIKIDAERLAEPTGLFANTRSRIYSWWARQGGGDKFFSRKRLIGTAKKSAAMAVIGLPVGVAAGVAGVFLAGPIAGAAVTAIGARGIARGLMRGHIEKNANAKSVAAAQYDARLADQYQKIEEIYDQNQDDGSHIIVPGSVTDVFAEGTEKGVSRTRRRMLGSVALGAATGLAGAFVGELAHNALFGSGHTPSPVGPHPGVLHSPPNLPATEHVIHHPHLAPEHGATGKEFDVHYGDGIIREINDYANTHHFQGITPDKATQIYEHLHGQFGRDIIKLDSGSSTYMYGSDVRLSHPGMAHWWSPAVEAALREELSKAAA